MSIERSPVCSNESQSCPAELNRLQSYPIGFRPSSAKNQSQRISFNLIQLSPTKLCQVNYGYLMPYRVQSTACQQRAVHDYHNRVQPRRATVSQAKQCPGKTALKLSRPRPNPLKRNKTQSSTQLTHPYAKMKPNLTKYIEPQEIATKTTHLKSRPRKRCKAQSQPTTLDESCEP